MPCVLRAILLAMQTAAAPPRAPAGPSFAGMLADFARPEKKFPPSREDGGLTDDVATLSYESALRSHARYRLPVIEPEILRERIRVSTPADDIEERLAAAPAIVAEAAAVASSIPDYRAALELSRKCASVTVRLTQPENAQLRERAAESGLTVSAYLRSCAFEVETLRAQVKQAMAELRSSDRSAKPAPNEKPLVRKALPWWRRFFLNLGRGTPRA